MRIDAHQHFWKLSRGDYGWLTPDLAAIYRDYEPADLTPLLNRCGIAKTILVQAAPTEAETRFMLGIANQHAYVAGVVGWVDLEASGAAQRITTLAKDPLLVALRPMLHDLPSDDWILSSALTPAIEAMTAAGLVFDALVRPRHLPALETFARRHANLCIVIDHAAKPEIANRVLDPWREHMAQLARLPNTVVKLSGMITEASKTWRVTDLAPYCDHILQCFGPDRILWGSDWPVLTLAATYERWLAASETLLAGSTELERDAIFGGTAVRVYLKLRGKPAMTRVERP